MTASIDQSTDAWVQSELLAFLSARTKTDLEPDRDLFASGLVSSLFAMELVAYVEDHFGVVVGGDDLRLDTFRTVDRITALVRRLRSEAAGG
ncbi:acyl carrier protein [Micromonospora sp. DT229]|uniref:acyl carrier protein n=1 Tax=Micromonospora sp. DT229 TaxID=3393430 RepID=UPI003CECB901